MKPSPELIAQINAKLVALQERGVQGPYVALGDYPVFDGLLIHTQYGSVRFRRDMKLEGNPLYVVSRRDYRLMKREARRAK